MVAPSPVDPANVGRHCQMVYFGLITGVLIFAVVAMTFPRELDAPQSNVIGYLGLAAGTVLLIVRTVVPSVIAANGVRRAFLSDEHDLSIALAPVYLAKVIVGGAILEGAAFLNLVAYFVSRNALNFAMAGVMLVILAVTFPSQHNFESWVERVQRDRM